MIRIVTHEVEARLVGPVHGPCGKSEYKVYGNGERRLTVKLWRLAPAGGEAIIAIAGRECARLRIERPSIRYDARTSRGDMVPEPLAGESIEIRVGGELIASGAFRPD